MTVLRRQQGAAIIVALFVTSLVAIAAITMIERMKIDMRKTTLLFNQQQAYFYVQGAVSWAQDQLITNWKNKKPNALIDKIPITSSTDRVNEFVIQSTLLDAQSFFSLNNVNTDNGQQFFMRLLQRLNPTLSPTMITELVNETRNWVSPGNNFSADAYYGKLNPSYHAAHQAMMSRSEWRLIKNITPELFEKTQRFIIALPENTALNINTADPILLSVLNPTLPDDIVLSLIANRKNGASMSIDKLTHANAIPITTESNYFLLQTNVTVASQSLVFYTLLKREIKNNQPTVITVWQTQGTL